MEEEKKDNKGLKIGFILFLVLCLIGSCVFIYKRTYVGTIKEETKEDKVEIPNLSKILKMIPVKLDNGDYSSYKVSELTDKEINNTIINYAINNSGIITKDNEKYYLEKLSNIEDNLFNLLGLEKYNINIDAGKDYEGYILEKINEYDVDYLKVKLTESAGKDTIYELQDLNNITYDKESKEYTVNVLVIKHVSGEPDLRIGQANLILKSDNGKITLKEVQFNKYNETDQIE